MTTRVDDFADATWSIVPGSIFSKRITAFNPQMYGFDTAAYQISEWAERAALHDVYNRMITGELLDEKDKRDNSPLYPLKINVWDFICTLHAYMSTGAEDNARPAIVFHSEESDRARKRADRYTDWVNDALSESAIDWFSLFYNMNVYGAAPLVMRYDQSKRYNPIWFEMVSTPNFYPILDSAGRVIAFFIARQISHAEAKLRYGVTVDSVTLPTYIEYWDPPRFEVRINDTPAYYPDGSTTIRGKNPFGFAPAVYIPHLRKRSLYGDSQLWRTEELVKEFNARVADISYNIYDDANVGFWGYNIESTKIKKIGGKRVIDLGRYLDGKLIPNISALGMQHAIKEGSDFVDQLWNLILHISDIPQIALGVDEGSQRSSLTLRARFWMLESHCHVERNNATEQLIRLARMVVSARRVLGYPVATTGREPVVSCTWPGMLPQDRVELVNEIIQRRASQLISKQHAIEMFGDTEDIEAELQRIDSDAVSDIKLQALLKSLTVQQTPDKQPKGGTNGTSKQDR